jgi:hypothetical protein
MVMRRLFRQVGGGRVAIGLIVNGGDYGSAEFFSHNEPWSK